MKRASFRAAPLATIASLVLLIAADSSAATGDTPAADGFTWGGMSCGSLAYLENSSFGEAIEVTNFILSEAVSGGATVTQLAYTVVNRSDRRANAYVELAGLELVDDDGLHVAFVMSSSLPLGVAPTRSESWTEKLYSFDGSRLEAMDYACIRVVLCNGC